MKKILVICGTGVATSTVVLNKLKDWFAENDYSNKVQLSQAKVADAISKIDDYDMVISTTIVPDSIAHKVTSGLCLITGINTGVLYEQIKQELDK